MRITSNKNIVVDLPDFQVGFDLTPTEACFPTTVKIVNLISTAFGRNYL